MSTQPRFLTLKDVADELALTDAMARSLVRTGELPAIQVGPKRVWRIERVKLEEYIEQRYAEASAGVGSEDVAVTPPVTHDWAFMERRGSSDQHRARVHHRGLRRRAVIRAVVR